MLNATRLKYSYNKELGFEFPDIVCDGGESCLIIGRSGVGKTTLLHLLAGLLIADSGEILIGDKAINNLKGHQLDTFRGRNIGIVFQKPHFISSTSILSNMYITQKLAGRSKNKEEIIKLLEDLGISERTNFKPNSLSQGELQRASVARAILNKPKVILADEPTSALDDISCNKVVKLLQNAAKELNAALIIVTHDSRLKSIVNHQIELT